MSFYIFAKNVCKIYLKIFYRLECEFKESIPTTGAVIFAGNHTSNFDPVIIGATQKRELSFLAKDELFKVPVFGFILKYLNVLHLKRGAGDIATIKKTIQLLEEGRAIVVFPEGTRSKDGEIGKGKDGVSMLAKKACCNVVPCAINGKAKIFRKTKIIYGKPIDMTMFNDEKDLKVITSYIMSEIKKLMEEF